MSAASTFLTELNTAYVRLHRQYENHFWVSYMGDHTVDAKKDKALKALDSFRGNSELKEKAETLSAKAKKKEKERLNAWIGFFDQYQMLEKAKRIKMEIDALETEIAHKRSHRTEGYVDPATDTFVPASSHKMQTLIRTHPDEAVRKACFQAREEKALDLIDEYVALVKLRNAFAQSQGYTDFYDYKLRKIDRMTKKELFSLFDHIYRKTKDTFKTVRSMEKRMSGLRKPWNFAYLLTGDFTREEDPYFQFEDAIPRWGRSFAALGIDFKGGTLQLDLLDRKGKYNNGFCHWPEIVRFENGKRLPAAANFTCNVVAGQVGSGMSGYKTLFHEGGHAAHLLNSEQRDVCHNHEYAPMTAAWAETQSMFIDTILSSIEWKSRYAMNAEGEAYPFELFERKERKLNILRPFHMLSIISVADFERKVYELKEPTAEKIIAIAKKNHTMYTGQTEASPIALNVPHIYAWESSCSYHGYGLATIALTQWREHLYKKYGYIVDNPNVGKEMRRVWQLGASKDFKECVRIATGKNLSSSALIKELMMPAERAIRHAKVLLKRMEEVKEYKKPVRLNANIRLVHGKKTIATNAESFETMAARYGAWVRKMAEEK